VRAKPGEVTARFDSRRTQAETELCRKLARWTSDHRDELERFDPVMPEGVFNRVADNLRPLLAIAQVAGGDWPSRAAAAFAALNSSDQPDEHGTGAGLLADIRSIYEAARADRLPSAKIVEALAAMEGRPWPEFKHGKAITPNQMARLLTRFKIQSRTVRIGDETAKGYHLADFEDAFERFLPSSPSSKRNCVTTQLESGAVAASEASQPEPLLPPGGRFSPCGIKSCDAVTSPDEEVTTNGACWSDGSPIPEPPDDLATADKDRNHFCPEEDAVTI
jgi:hypothetical protein